MNGETVFEPTEKHQLEEYPELANYEEFKPLTREEMRLVWYYANQTSPFYDTSPMQTKISKCFDAAWGNLAKESEKVRYLSGNFPAIVQMAINRMRMFNPEKRSRSLMMLEKVFADYEEIITNFKPKAKEGDKPVSLDKVKEYVDLTTKITAQLPTLVQELEEGFGVKKKIDGKSTALSIFDAAIKSKT